MDNWTNIRKGNILLYIECGQSPGDTVLSHNIRLREKPEFEVCFDLSKNLHRRGKNDTFFYSTRELASGKITELSLVQLDEKKVIEDIYKYLYFIPNKRDTWKLTIHIIDEDWSFTVKPKIQGPSNAPSLFLYVYQ